MQLTLNYVTIYTEDFNAARHFYKNLLQLPEMQTSPTQGYSVFQTTCANLIIQSISNKKTTLPAKSKRLVGRVTGISLTTKDIQTSYNQLSMQGVSFLTEPVQESWGGWVAYFEDIDRNILTLVG